jgi:hypothetical protein
LRFKTQAAKGNKMNKATAQRKKLSVMGGTKWLTSRPTTTLPAHSKGGTVSSKAVRGESFWDMLNCIGMRVFPLSPSCPPTAPAFGSGSRFVAKSPVSNHHSNRRTP